MSSGDGCTILGDNKGPVSLDGRGRIRSVGACEVGNFT